MAQDEFLTHRNGQRCLYLIDDFASELNTGRRRLLAERLNATYALVFVSAVNTDQIRDITDEKSKMFKVEKGKISLQSEI